MPNVRLWPSADSIPDYDARLLPRLSDDTDGPSLGPRQDSPGVEMGECKGAIGGGGTYGETNRMGARVATCNR